MSCRFVGYGHQRLNLFPKDIISKDAKVVDAVHKLASKIVIILRAKNLRALTNLKKLLDNVTQWSSTHYKPVRYQRIRGFTQQIYEENISRLLIFRPDNQKIDSIVECLMDLDLKFIKLQKGSKDLAYARFLFDASTKKYLSLMSRPWKVSFTVWNPPFERA